MLTFFKIISEDKKNELTCSLFSPEIVLQEDDRRTLVILIHDFPGEDQNGIKNLYANLGPPIVAERYHLLTFDFKGCGSSSGKPEDFSISSALEDLKSIFSWAEHEQKFDQYVLVGSGLGASLALMSAHENTKALVLLWPVLDLPKWADDFLSTEDDQIDFSNEGYTITQNNKIGFELIQELKETDIIPFLKNTNIPTLIQHGAKDERVPIEHLDLARAHLNAPRIDITVYDTGEYGLATPEQREALEYHVIEFIKKYT